MNAAERTVVRDGPRVAADSLPHRRCHRKGERHERLARSGHLYVQDVARLADFYRTMFGLPLIEAIPGEWAVFRVGSCELALHRVGRPYRVADPSDWQVDSNAKLVLTVDRELDRLRSELIETGVPMGEIKSYPGFTGQLCDGRDPEGNVFQLAEAPDSRH
jgi:predicted enzyme related to lactoylglutathione lyase